MSVIELKFQLNTELDLICSIDGFNRWGLMIQEVVMVMTELILFSFP